MKQTYLTLAGVALATTFATTSFAHATLETQSAEVGSTYKGVMRIGHGCEGAATHTVIIDIPDGFYNAKPMPKAGWTLETKRGDYATPYTAHGTEYTEGVQQIIWSGGDLQDDWYDEFVFRGSFGPELAEGDFFFPATQVCDGGEHAWTNVTNDPDAGSPAPKLELTAGTDDHSEHAMDMMTHGTDAADMDHAAIELGDLTLSNIYANATLPNAPVAGGFLTIENHGGADDRLVSVASNAAGLVQVHEMAMDGDIMRMRELPEGLPLPAGGSVELMSGGFHIMFLKLEQQLVEGETIMVTLSFETAGDIEVPMQVRAKTSMNHGN